MIDLTSHVGAIARRLLGTPNPKLSTSVQLRFGTNGSVAVEIAGPKSGSWFDHETGENGGPIQLIETKGGVANGEVVDWLRSELGIEAEPERGAGRGKIVKTYDYKDEKGDLLFQVVRFDPKDFRQRRPDGHGGWVWSTKGIRKVPYLLPRLLATPPEMYVFVCEGEKDVDRLTELDLRATCNPGGAARRGADGKPARSKWPREFGPQFFRDRRVVILPDNDDAGRDHAQAIVKNLLPVAHEVFVVELPGLPPKGDVSDWLDAGGTREELEQLVLAAPIITLVEEPDDAPADDGIDNTLTRPVARRFLRLHAAAQLHFCADPRDLAGEQC